MISLIIPVYNVKKFLIDCLESVINQTVQFSEVIIVDDDSTDGSSEICLRYANKYTYIRYIKIKHQGLSVARNSGMEIASQPYIMFLDSDDYINVETVKCVMEIIKKYYPETIYFNSICIAENKDIELLGIGRTNHRILKENNKIFMTGSELFAENYPERYSPVVWMGVYQTAIIKKINLKFPVGINYEDNYFTLVWLLNTKKVYYLNNLLYYQRVRENSITSSVFTENDLRERNLCFILIFEYIYKHIDEVKSYASVFALYISNLCHIELSYYINMLENQMEISIESENSMKEMAATYLRTILLKEFCGMDDGLLFKRADNLYYIIKCKLADERLCNLERDVISPPIIEFYYNLLKNIPLRLDKKVGIYGTGKATIGLLSIYKKVYGDIRAKIFFINTKKTKEFFQGEPIYCLNEVGNLLDVVVISSRQHESEMISCVNSIAPDLPVYTINYSKDIEADIFANYDAFMYL